jgi:hypothetical protein
MSNITRLNQMFKDNDRLQNVRFGGRYLRALDTKYCVPSSVAVGLQVLVHNISGQDDAADQALEAPPFGFVLAQA